MGTPAVSKPLGKTGSASIVKQGHTATGRFGDEPMAKSKTTGNPRDLSAK